MTDPSPDAPDPTFEEARDELVAIVAQLEAGNVPLSESMALWERGEALAGVCQRWLDGARQRIDTARAATDDAEG